MINGSPNEAIYIDLFTLISIKIVATYMRYFAKSKFSRSLVHKGNFELI